MWCPMVERRWDPIRYTSWTAKWEVMEGSLTKMKQQKSWETRQVFSQLKIGHQRTFTTLVLFWDLFFWPWKVWDPKCFQTKTGKCAGGSDCQGKVQEPVKIPNKTWRLPVGMPTFPIPGMPSKSAPGCPLLSGSRYVKPNLDSLARSCGFWGRGEKRIPRSIIGAWLIQY